jgi:hypothetical protein
MPPWWANRKCSEIPLVVVFASQPKLREDFVIAIRSELPASVEKSGG